MKFISRIIVGIAALSMIAVYFLPVWFIYLIAPQYPEGLTMNIWLNQITGQVEIINGLNHYIGMKHIKAEMFPEFKFLVYILAFLITYGLIAAFSGKLKVLFSYVIILVLGGVAAMIDFYKWGYDYGHNLDPKAAIQIPGFSYQPPLFGHKTLLNFDAYSYPDSGGWVIIVAGILIIATCFYEWLRRRKIHRAENVKTPKAVSIAIVASLVFLSSCTTRPQPFVYGQDVCDDCKMTIMDAKFGGEIVTKKGKVYKFDDAHCLANFLKAKNVKQEDIAQTVFVDYEKEQNFLDAQSLSFVESPQYKSPMNSNVAAFVNTQIAEEKAKQVGGKLLSWQQFLDKSK